MLKLFSVTPLSGGVYTPMTKTEIDPDFREPLPGALDLDAACAEAERTGSLLVRVESEHDICMGFCTRDHDLLVAEYRRCVSSGVDSWSPAFLRSLPPVHRAKAAVDIMFLNDLLRSERWKDDAAALGMIHLLAYSRALYEMEAREIAPDSVLGVRIVIHRYSSPKNYRATVHLLERGRPGMAIRGAIGRRITRSGAIGTP